MLYKVAGQNTDEADEDFLHALGRLALYDGTLLGVLQVEQEDLFWSQGAVELIDKIGTQNWLLLSRKCAPAMTS
ncbi:MAG: hypothetical protein IK031_03705 [Bacteroidales bacterium]|nr:hypothetical protein [Bacteroidales bacterium]